MGTTQIEITEFPAFLVYQPYETGGVLTELDCYLYAGIKGAVEQYVAHVGLIQVKDGVFLVNGAVYDEQEAAIWALYEQWQKGGK